MNERRGRGTQYGGFESVLDKPTYLTSSANRVSGSGNCMNTAKGFLLSHQQRVIKEMRGGRKGNLSPLEKVGLCCDWSEDNKMSSRVMRETKPSFFDKPAR